jgi:feruloyl esterase
MKPRILILAISALVALAGGFAGLHAGQGSGSAPSAQTCSALTRPSGMPNPRTVITAAVWNPAAAALPAQNPQGPGTPALPEHCEVVGKLNERTGVNGQRYAINFRLRLPTAWNGRFFFQGGGATNGTIGNALVCR